MKFWTFASLHARLNVSRNSSKQMKAVEGNMVERETLELCFEGNRSKCSKDTKRRGCKPSLWLATN